MRSRERVSVDGPEAGPQAVGRKEGERDVGEDRVVALEVVHEVLEVQSTSAPASSASAVNGPAFSQSSTSSRSSAADGSTFPGQKSPWQ